MQATGTLRLIAATGILIVTVGAAQAQIINGGFETDPVGTFDFVTGWQVIGKTSILDATSNMSQALF